MWQRRPLIPLPAWSGGRQASASGTPLRIQCSAFYSRDAATGIGCTVDKILSATSGLPAHDTRLQAGMAVLALKRVPVNSADEIPALLAAAPDCDVSVKFGISS
eukprot:TRINITY_DN27901_c0_g1_i1.p2 TRINITY_DN27901_c0_g1~~TRINITY_DN27901_c0_g1_i1.p2  ORF type:complete len:104 (+),score=4.85 TRINITY_DN27901_c0_g1_i1:270-581(+)